MYSDEQGHFATAKVEQKTKTRQELFNIAYRGLRSQGWQRASVGKVYMYRVTSKLRCAVGWNIPDDAYRTEFEGQTVGLSNNSIIAAAGADEHDSEFLYDMQRAHDSMRNDDPVSLKRRMIELAFVYRLVVPR